MPYYKVVQGDHLSSIARDFGFTDYHTIWDDGNNAELKAKRKNPNVLYPGDNLFIPVLEPKEVDGGTEKKHKFKVKKPKLKLRLVLQDSTGKPLKDVKCKLLINADEVTLKTDSSGKLEHELNPQMKDARVMFADDGVPFEPQLPVSVGHLDPIDTVSGQVGRLMNLGYFLGDPKEPEDEDVRSAVEEFQCEQGLTVDGKCGAVTQGKLKEVHGC
jgi:N-acetylmuramoyl-L-alanine amidase